MQWVYAAFNDAEEVWKWNWLGT